MNAMTNADHFNRLRYSHWIKDHVRFSDLDPLGHVNNNAIGTYFENARAALFAILTPSWPYGNNIFVLARSAIDFRHELHYPAQLMVGSCVLKIGTTSMVLANALFNEDTGNGIAFCESVSVLIDKDSRKPVPLPPELRAKLEQFRDGLNGQVKAKAV